MCEYNFLCDSLQMKEYNKLLWFDFQETLRSEGLWSLILNRALMPPSWMSNWTYLTWCEGLWLDLKLNWRKIPTLIWKSRNELDFLGSKGALLDLEMTLYFGSINRVFLSKFLSSFFFFFFIWETSIYRQLNSIWFGIFSQHLLRVNYEFNFVFHLIRAFHMSFFFQVPMLPHDFLHLMLSRSLISFADHPCHQLGINLIMNNQTTMNTS